VHAERESLAAFDPSAFDTPSTKAAAKLIADWGATGSVLVVLSEAEAQAALSFRNLDQVRAVLPSEGVGVADLVGAANVLASKAALQELAARATGTRAAAAAGEEA
jgi:large subunit ribosomal protein L4